METEWAHCKSSDPRGFYDGARNFVISIHASKGYPKKIQCPCSGCINIWSHPPNEVLDHLISNGLYEGYCNCTIHGDPNTSVQQEMMENMENLETYRMYRDAYLDDEFMEPAPAPLEPNVGNLVSEAELPLFTGCPFTKMSATVMFYKFKARNSLSDSGYDELLEMVRSLLPPDNILPSSLYSTKKLLKAFDLGYEKIHACVNDCCLFRKSLEHMETCPKCGASRWKVNKRTQKIEKGVPAKVLRYFPIIPRFRRMFKDSEKAEQLTWHHTHKSQDGKMRHPVDSLAWKKIDSKWPSFAEDPRNLRLGLSSDGFNPFGDLSSRYSCWPVILVAYNLPPSLCMSKEHLMLTLLIPGPKQPGNDIDVYLEPLIEDLKELWINGVTAYDAFTKSAFNLKAILMWTINDFPAYGNLSGYSTKGKKACPVCGVQTSSQWLPNGRKHAYMCHRRFLAHDHPYRHNKTWFNGTEEHRVRPRKLTGSEVFQVVKNIKNNWGKEAKRCTRKKKKKVGSSNSRKRRRTEGKKSSVNEMEDDSIGNSDDDSDDDSEDPLKPSKRWKKKSMFFELPYWEALLLRHNLDMMHIEKNICESIIGTLLNMKGKTKDNLNSRKDLKVMGIKKKLHPKEDGSSKSKSDAAPYVLSKKEKKIFCKRLAKLRLPDGYCSNLANRVSLQDNKIMGLKSHDCHVLIQQILAVALKGLLPKGPRIAIFRLCSFFHQLCQREIEKKNIGVLDEEIAETVCMFERFFPPSFFDIMVHLPIHLAQEALIGGPVHFRWMYPFERFMKDLKGYVKNRSNPEGCIAEKYLAEEMTRFCSGYIKGAAEIGVQSRRNEDFEHETILEGRPLGEGKLKLFSSSMLEIAHRFVWTNSSEVDPWREMHREELKYSDTRLEHDENLLEQRHLSTFSGWLADKVKFGDSRDMSDTVKWIACRPKADVVSHTGFIINGNRFQTEASEKSTQNSGVFVEGDTMCRASARDNFQKMDRISYYGVIRDIVLLDYRQFKVPLFDCYWANIGTGVKFEDGFTLVNLHKGQHQFDRDPFIFASQAKQVFYSRESDTSNWHVVLKAPPRGFFENDSDESAYMPVDVSQLDLDVEDEECERYDNEEINSSDGDSE
ncbi:uncharacterized protein LOC133731433 [Rosa rugosa]|uniref:uncharacterized protein LOC133731433 n=1 Tax=Rosa rugosa TaxID=74645 RepID=UPI002B409658|nr:uncharacterized protein LOC133731433 [Rosa rugosa]